MNQEKTAMDKAVGSSERKPLFEIDMTWAGRNAGVAAAIIILAVVVLAYGCAHGSF